MKFFFAFLAAAVVFVCYDPVTEISEGKALSTIRSTEAATTQTVSPSVLTDTLAHAFERAVWNNDLDAIRQLIQAGVDINRINPEDGYAALHWAVERRHVDAVGILLNYGADAGLMTRNAIGRDRTALHIAAELGYPALVEMLVQSGADPNSVTSHGETPLHGVRQFVRNLDAVRLLIEHGANVNAETSFRTTPLHAAALLGSADIVAELIAHGARIDAVNMRGLTPLHHAAQQGHLAVASMLTQSKTRLDAQSKNGDTALHLAAKKGHVELVRLLLEHGANPTTLNRFSKSPLAEARDRAHQGIVELLSASSALTAGG